MFPPKVKLLKEEGHLREQHSIRITGSGLGTQNPYTINLRRLLNERAERRCERTRAKRNEQFAAIVHAPPQSALRSALIGLLLDISNLRLAANTCRDARHSIIVTYLHRPRAYYAPLFELATQAPPGQAAGRFATWR